MKKFLLFLFCLLCCLPVCRAASNHNDSIQETNNIKAVMQKCFELLDEGKLPGMSKDDHGEIHGYQLTDSVKKLLIDKKAIDEKMLHDVEGYHDPYFIGMDTKDQRRYGYFFSLEKGDVVLVSAYHWENDGWVKIHGPIR